jgi:CopA family copper-resistance protein
MSRKDDLSAEAGLPLSRRRFVQGMAAGGVLLGISSLMRTASAQDAGAAVVSTATPLLAGSEFALTIAETPVDFTGVPRLAAAVNGSLPGPTLRWRGGDTVTIRVTNRLRVPTSLHWHGMILPYQMDGVPGISFRGIGPGETFTYRFLVRQSGTYWYHSHSGFQEQTGLYGAIIIDPRGGEPVHADRDYIVHLSDWTDEDPMAVFAKLKRRSDYYNFNRPTAGDFIRDVTTMGLSAALARRRMWDRMRMDPTDIADVSGHTYTYLMNGATPAGNWTGLFRPGERVRLRFIGGGSQTFFDVRIPGLKMTVVQHDGQDLEPVTVDEFRCAPGETYDVLVTPKDDAYTLFAQAMDRSGYARGTLAVRAGLAAPVPELDPPQWLGLADMMGAAAHGGGAAMPGMEHDRHPTDAGMDAMASRPAVRHARTEFGPSVDMRVGHPRTNLDDPGVGLRHNGRRVLTYADLHTPGGPLDPRGAEREIELHLTGNMARYAWSIDGLEFGRSSPVHFGAGERLRVILHNDTLMTHPMHLHGMWQELENPDGRFQVRKHTIGVQPAQRVSFLVSADALGRWAWHCHLLYHMEAGMFREVVVS